MAPHKQPSLLLNICLKSVACMINNACKALGQEYEFWNILQCKNGVHCIQQFILSVLRPKCMLDVIFNEYASQFSVDYDPRILIAVYMHKDMNEFQMSKKYNVELVSDSLFLTDMLYHARNIVSLNLTNVCSDNVLKIVSENCSNLEYINIMSTYLKLNDVSDTGLVYLENCVKLKEIIMENDLEFMGKKITVGGVSRLLGKLPALENISYGNTGHAVAGVDDDVNSLALTKVNVYDPKASDIVAMSRLCENLQELVIRFPYFVFLDDAIVSETSDALANSSLCVGAIKLYRIPVSESLFGLINRKGEFLSSFTLTSDLITKRFVKSIGKHCPNINHLHLFQTKSVTSGQSDNSLVQSSVAMFSKLKSVTLYGMFFSLENILPLLLSHAKDIEKITLFKADNIYLDETFSNILLHNPMTNINELYLRCFLTFKTILYFFNSPHVTKLSFLQSNISSQDISMLRSEINDNNFDISLNVL